MSLAAQLALSAAGFLAVYCGLCWGFFWAANRFFMLPDSRRPFWASRENRLAPVLAPKLVGLLLWRLLIER